MSIRSILHVLFQLIWPSLFMSTMFKISYKYVFITPLILCIQLVKSKSIMSIIVIFKTKMVSRPQVFIVVMASLILYAESGTSTTQPLSFFLSFCPINGINQHFCKFNHIGLNPQKWGLFMYMFLETFTEAFL